MGFELGYKSIIGRKDVVDKLTAAAGAGMVAHSYIFAGEAGLGKKYIAKLFAMALQCERDQAEPCMQCKSCKMAAAGNHPDIVFVSHEKPASIGVEDIRKQIVEDVDIRPYCSKRKVYIVPDASKMTAQAQNALLKTLEEPPAYVTIILLADNVETLLDTILSRCVVINLKPVPDDKIREYLMQEMAVPEYEAGLQAAFAQGNLGKAKKLASAGDFYEKLQESLRFLKKSKESDTAERLEFGKKMAADKQGIDDYLEIFTLWFRDVLYFKASYDPDGIIFKEEYKAVKKRASVSSYEGLMAIIDAIEAARNRLRANVNPELVLELLFLTIWEN